VQRILYPLYCMHPTMYSINFCGDSFCKSGGNIGKHADAAWTTLLANKLNADIIGLGRSGTAHEHVFQSFKPDADYTVFCWTEPHRIWHPQYALNMASADSLKKQERIYAVADLYYKYLHDTNYAVQRFQRECYWFDHAILANYQGKCIHLDCFESIYTWTSGIAHTIPILNQLRTTPYQNSADEVANHFTRDQNTWLADELFKLFVCKENDDDLYCK
jgi:hypothetical protein